MVGGIREDTQKKRESDLRYYRNGEMFGRIYIKKTFCFDNNVHLALFSIPPLSGTKKKGGVSAGLLLSNKP